MIKCAGVETKKSFGSKRNIGFVTLGLMAVIAGQAQAATIVVDGADGTVADDGICSIVEAVAAANSDTASGAMSGECVAGSGADIIELSQDVTLSAAAVLNYSNQGNVGLPIIDTNITLNGMGHVLQRDNKLICNNNGTTDDAEFRLFYIEDSGVLSIENTLFSYGCVDGSSVADRFFGGVIWNDGELSVENSVFNFNRAFVGAAIYNNGIISHIGNSLFSDNDASRNAGAIYNNFLTTISSIDNSLFINNTTADREGGAFYNRGTITTINNSSFIDNYAVSTGGAIYTDGVINLISNSTFSNNSSDSDGGAINNNDVLAAINNSTFVNNSGRFGGAIKSSSNATSVNNTLFKGNSAQFSSAADCYLTSGSPSPVFSGSNNLSNQDNQNCLISMNTQLTSATVAAVGDNGCVTPLADGTCVLTHPLLIGSEALDAADALTATTTDQRGYAIENLLRDIGAFEANVDLIFANGFE